MARTSKAGTEGRARDRLTVLDVKRVGGQSQRGAAVVALEAAAVEELALGAQPLHHVDALVAEEAHVAAADVDGELFPEGALWEHQTPSVIFFFPLPLFTRTQRKRRAKTRLRRIEMFGEKIQRLTNQDDRQLLTSWRDVIATTTQQSSQYNQLHFVVKELRKTTTFDGTSNCSYSHLTTTGKWIKVRLI